MIINRYMQNVPWIEKHRPRHLRDINQNPAIIDMFMKAVEKLDIPHYLFYGPPGTGKTSTALALAREIYVELTPDRLIELNASDERGIGVVREKIYVYSKKSVSETIINGKIVPAFKFIILDESDLMTEEAQDAMRVIIEKYSSVTRFIFICNNITKITDAIKSRCTIIYFDKLCKDLIISKLKSIMHNEGMTVDDDTLSVITDLSKGDMRKAVMLLQNTKYLYDYKCLFQKKIKDTTIRELKFFSKYRKPDTMVEPTIYEMSAQITLDQANDIVNHVINCENMNNVYSYCKSLMNSGWPVDNMINQINRVIILHNKITTQVKSKIIVKSGDILSKIYDSANEYLQMLTYLGCIYCYHKNI